VVSDRSLSSRWEGDDGTALAAQVLTRLVAGEPLDDLGLDRHEDRWDLRGLAVPDPEIVATAEVVDASSGDVPPLGVALASGFLTFRGVGLADLDLSGARLQHLRFFDVTLSNCVFEGAACQDWRGWRLDVEGCSFRNAKLRDAALGTWSEQRGNRFTDVDFRRADLRGSVWQGAVLVDCDFGEARLDGVEFRACELIRCRFAGLLDEVRFLGDPSVVIDKPDFGRFEDVDFSGATLRTVEFLDLSLSGVTFPDESDEQVVVHHYPCVVRRALELLGDDLSPEVSFLRSTMRADNRRMDDSREVGVWHVDQLGDTPESQRNARELLHRLERECADG
jgi:uncharacterized protein YjbI with pentapeptide repeats